MVYRVSGLNIVSDTPLEELTPLTEAGDYGEPLVIQLRSRGERPLVSKWFLDLILPDGTLWASLAKDSSGGYLLRYNGLADFWVGRSGRHVTCCARSDGTSDLTIRALLLYQVLPLIFALHGKYALHASAVMIGGGICAFGGYSGVGKSTLAAHLALGGYQHLTDDCLIIEESGGRMMASAAHSGVRLFDDALDRLMLSAEKGAPVAGYTSKRCFPLSAPPSLSYSEPCPLTRIYFLARGAEGSAVVPETQPRIQRLSARDFFMKLVNHSVRLDPTDRKMLLCEFEFTQRLVAAVSAALLWMPDDLTALDSVKEAIVRDLENN